MSFILLRIANHFLSRSHSVFQFLSLSLSLTHILSLFFSLSICVCHRGNHYVKVFVTIPTALTERQRALMEEFASEGRLEKERNQGRKISVDEDDY